MAKGLFRQRRKGSCIGVDEEEVGFQLGKGLFRRRQKGCRVERGL